MTPAEVQALATAFAAANKHPDPAAYAAEVIAAYVPPAAPAPAPAA